MIVRFLQKFKGFSVGDESELSDAVAFHFIENGLVEPVGMEDLVGRPQVVAGMLRIKNEPRIAEVVASMRPLCTEVVVFDDHSTDDTVRRARAAGARVILSPYEGINEPRDKDLLLQRTMNLCDPDWILCIDGDEVLAPGGQEQVLRSIGRGSARAFKLQVVYLWDRPDQIRVDGIYADFRRPSLFNTRRSLLTFRRTSFGGGFHCSNVPADLLGSCGFCEAKLLHYGYMDRDQRISKYHWYNSIDPGNQVEDGYRHMVQGDLEEIQPDSKLLHAGPLRLVPLDV